MGVKFFTVHASGGSEMMRVAADAVAEQACKESIERPQILAITVLTSLSNEILRGELNIEVALERQVRGMAELAKVSGMDGVVASPQEIKSIREACGETFIILTPGIRPAGSGSDDQRRVTTPREAIEAGADYIVVGRPIVKAQDSRVEACRRVIAEIVGQ